MEKFVGQPVTPPSTPHKGELMSPPRQPTTGTPPIASNLPPTFKPPQTIYSPMVNKIVTFFQMHLPIIQTISVLPSL